MGLLTLKDELSRLLTLSDQRPHLGSVSSFFFMYTLLLVAELKYMSAVYTYVATSIYHHIMASSALRRWKSNVWKKSGTAVICTKL